MIFELIVVDTKVQADFINLTVPMRNDHIRVYASYVGQGICGLNYQGVRPTRLTRWHSELTTDMQKRWESEATLPAMGWRNG